MESRFDAVPAPPWWEWWQRRWSTWSQARPWLVPAGGLILGAVGGAVVLLVALGRPTAGLDAAEVPVAVRAPTPAAAPRPLVVHVSGAVASPGVYEVEDGSRVSDALRAAGGPATDADLDLVNLAELLTDSVRVHIPRAGEPVPAVAPLAPTPGSGAGAPLDLNRATEADLDDLPGVGPATAAAIVRHRDENGAFLSVDELIDVPGIGPAKLEALRDLLTV